MTSRDYAALSEDSYRHPQHSPNSQVTIEGVSYRVLANGDNPRTGYQGTIYQRTDNHEIVVAHRGTEPGRGTGELFRDAVRTDGGMVVNGVNNQTQDAIALTQRALDLARAEAERTGRPAPEVSVTGHSLGGTLAQVTASHFHLHGETFNAYGAAGLRQGVPAGGHDVINHVRATDVVSAASPHYGEVRVYATREDIAALEHGGYANNTNRSMLPFVGDPRNPIDVAWNRGGPAHGIGAFVRAEGGGPLMTQDNTQRAAQFDPMIDKYRDDVAAIRGGITNTSLGVQHGVERLRQGWHDIFSQRTDVQRAPLVGDSPMVEQTYAALERNRGQVGDLDSRSVASLVAGARQQGLTSVDSVAANDRSLFAVQGRAPDDPAAKIATVDRVEAQQQPIAVSAQLAANAPNVAAPQQQETQQRAMGRG
jgi:hypothetical protein